MIIKEKTGNILREGENRIAFPINQEGINNSSFAGLISSLYWPELANIGETKLGSVLTKKTHNMEFYGICCYSLVYGWKNQYHIIRNCFNSIPGDAPVASVSIGEGMLGILNGANFNQIRAGMEASDKKIILY